MVLLVYSPGGNDNTLPCRLDVGLEIMFVFFKYSDSSMIMHCMYLRTSK